MYLSAKNSYAAIVASAFTARASLECFLLGLRLPCEPFTTLPCFER